MKTRFKNLKASLKSNTFLLFAFFSLLVPDFLLRGLVSPDVFAETFVGPVSILFSVFWAFMILFLCAAVLPRRLGRIVFSVLNSLIIILSVCQYAYFKIFGHFFWIKSISLVGEGADYFSYAVGFLDFKSVVCVSLSCLFLVLSIRGWQKLPLRKSFSFALVLIFVLGIFALHLVMQPSLFNESTDDWDSWRRPRSVYTQFSDINKSWTLMGLYQLTARDIFNTVFVPDTYSEEDFAKVDRFLEKPSSLEKNEYSGIFEGKNVIAVMLEGIDTWMVSEKYTPTIHYMMENGINLTNFYSPFFGTGHTFNAEFAFNTGFFSPLSAISATTFSSNLFPYSMANLFTQKGYSVNSFHYNDPEFYNRGIMHKNFGYSEYHSFSSFGIPETVAQSDSNILKYDSIYQKMTDAAPFFTFVITYSGHVPYTYEDSKLALAKQNHPDLIDPNMDTETNSCLLLARDTDDFFSQLLTRLKADGLLEDTVIVAYTDHYAYGFSNQELMLSYKENENKYRVPAFIFSPGIKHKEVSKPTSTIDFLPTMVNLFSLESPIGFLGNDIFDPKNNGFVYFGDMSWMNGSLYFDPLHDDLSTPIIPPELTGVIKENNARVKELCNITEIVITGDYFRHR